jgi:pyruvate dehydrogenase E2 component (dihydrolipoamide acetyltransferase)
MAIEVFMPRMSDTMEEGKILKWLKKVGDQVELGDIIAEVETDKADMEMEALDAGVLTEIRAQEGESVPVGDIIALLGDATEVGKVGAAAPAAVKKATRPSDSPPEKKVRKLRDTTPKRKSPARKKGQRLLASPIVRKIAAERGIDLTTVPGSGPGGRIVKHDLEIPETPPGAASAEPHEIQTASSTDRVESRVEPFSRMRATIAKRMAESMRQAPHFYVTTEIDMSESVRLRTSLKLSDRVEAEVTYTHLLVKATAVALERHPSMNATFAGDGRELKSEINIGIAVALEDGLIVPVLHGCQKMSLLDVAAQAHALVERARTGKPTSKDLSGGTFTISNLGMYSVEHFTAVINPPQAAILATSAIKERPVVRDGQVVISRTMMVTLSCDHRVLDGATGARFLEELKSLLESPVGLMV